MINRRHNIYSILSLLFVIRNAKAVQVTNDFLSEKDEVLDKRQFNNVNTNGGNTNAKVSTNTNNGGSIKNLDCMYISMLLNDFGLEYGWKQTNDCCRYKRIGCVDEKGQNAKVTTEKTIVTEVYFNDINIIGSIPNSICSMTNLKALLFVNNMGLSGPIPPCVGGLNKLEMLVFSGSPFSGEIPKSISALSNLKFLSIEKTNVQSKIPEEFTNLTKLVKLYINNNPYVNGPIPKDIDKLSQLEMVSFSDTNIEGNIPENIGNIKTLKSISVHHTHVEGKIPESIGNLSNLETIKFHDTNLSGPLPNSFKNLNNLKTLLLNNTNIEGAIPEEFNSHKFEVCSLGNSNICKTSVGNDITECISSLPVCSSNPGATKSQMEQKEGNGGVSVLKYTGIFLVVLIVIAIIVYFYKRYKKKVSYQHEKRAINYYKNNITEQPKWIETNIFQDPIVHNNNIHAYNIEVDQHPESSFLKKVYGGFSFSKGHNNYQKLNDNQYGNMESNNMYLIHSDSVFKYNTMGMEDGKKINPVNDDMTFKNNDETLVNNLEKQKLRNEYGYEPDMNQKSLDSERTEFENTNNRIYEAMTNNKINFNDSIFKGTSSSGSSIPLPPNSENMVFMGKEAQEELMNYQQKNNINVSPEDDTRSVKEQLEELEQMASNNYAMYGNKSPKPFKSPKSPKSPRSVKSPKPTKSPSNANSNVVIDYDCTNGSVDINDQIQELKNCSFNGLDLNSENFHNSMTFDKIEKKFLNNLSSLRNTNNNSTVTPAESNVEDSKNKEENFFANIPGLQIQEYYNQLNFSMEESNNTGWNNKESEDKNKENDKKFDKIIPSGIFTTNKTSWDDEDSNDSFFSNDTSIRNTKKTEDFSTSINSSALNKEIMSKLGTESMMLEGQKYNSISTDNKYKSGYTEDSRYKSGVTDDRYSKYTSYTEDSRYKSGVTDDRYSKYTSYTEDSRYKSGVTDDRYSKYTSYTEDSRYKSGVTDDRYSKYTSYTEDSRYKSGVTDEGYSRYKSGVTDEGYSHYKSGVTDEGYSRYKSGVTTEDGYSNYTDESRLKTLSIDPSAFDSLDIDRNSKIKSGYSYPSVVITGVDNKKFSTDTKNSDTTNYTDSTISKDFSNTGYSSGFTLSNANTLSSGFTFSTNEKTISNGSSLEPPRTNSSRTTKTSSNLNQVSTITGTDSMLSSFSKYSSIDTMGSVSSLSFTDNDSK
ncbi:hypothetical protein PIROE2DRAFT_60986 [Piromyces sp. E2]|nr:hypothetical protein PIROE2DRAFT_60986 [Piromyces sp. E2]|eukprot:OUM63965.1 hypothetical protein PIROE2DRAFT_60986 [Piromyces sp. E2]